MKAKVAILFSIVILLVVVGCTEKDNLIGSENSDLQPIEVIFDHTWMTQSFTYQDTVDNTGASGSFSVGLQGDMLAAGLLHFKGFADSLVVDSCAVFLGIEDRSAQPETFTFQLAKVLQEWDEDEVTGLEAMEDTPWIEPRFEFLDDSWNVQTTDSDTLVVPLPASLVQGWVDEDTLNFGMALSITGGVDGFCQFHSQEGTYEPRIEVYYTNNSNEPDTLTYYVIADAFIVDGEPAAGEQPADVIANVVPTRLFTKWDIGLDAFNANLPANLAFADSLELQRTTINRAEMLVSIDTTLCWIPEDIFTVYSYLVKDSVCVDSLPLTRDQLKSYAYTDIGELKDGELTVDFTPIMQAILAGFDDNNGFVVISRQECVNMGELRMPDFVTSARLRVVFTKPVIGDVE